MTLGIVRAAVLQAVLLAVWFLLKGSGQKTD